MASANKRLRALKEGGSSHHFISFGDADYSDVHVLEGRARKSHLQSYVKTTPVTIQRNERPWDYVSSWAPQDDPDFALDMDSGDYNAALEAAVVGDDAAVNDASGIKKTKSQVSKRPNVVWRDLHRQTYLDELVRHAGRADFHQTHCPDCLARSATTPSNGEYRCLECLIPDLSCRSCCLRRHRMHPLHRIERWVDGKFEKLSLKTLGLRVQLNHSGLFCTNPKPCHQAMTVMHTNGFHEVMFDFCGCTRIQPDHIQLLRRQLYPASQIQVRTCATFELLKQLHTISLTAKSSTYDLYRALDFLTDGTGLLKKKYCYRALSRMLIQWRHLKLLLRGGRGHAVEGATGTSAGELAITCPSCPHPGINLPENWNAAPLEQQFLNTKFVCMDANFRLKNQFVSSYSQDPGLGIGWTYMVPRHAYEDYVLSRVKDEDVSTCVGFQALAQANNRFSKGLRYTGVGGVFCGRSEMVLPNGVGNLHKGERYANMDYVFASAIHDSGLQHILVSYDIACQWFVNLRSRMTTLWPDHLQLSPSIKLTPAIPKLHEPMHEAANHQVFSVNLIPGVGNSDFEVPERFWAIHNPVGGSTKTQGPGSRHDVLDDHFQFWNWLKYIGLGFTLKRRFRRAVADRNTQVEAHRGLTSALPKEVVKQWEAMCLTWDNDSFPKTKPNPYEIEGSNITEAQAKKELAEEEERRLASGGTSLHATSAPAFVGMGLDLEEAQRRVRRLAKATTSKATARQEGGLTEQRNQLTNRIRAWEQLLPLYMPGLFQYQADERRKTGEIPTVPEYPEELELILPSRLPKDMREKICGNDLCKMEEKSRTAQCYGALESIRHTLKIKTRLIKFKNQNFRGQRDGTRSRAIIDRVHERARVAAEKYRVARVAKLQLSGPGNWESDLRALLDADIRGYQDLERLKVSQGRRGTLEDSQLQVLEDVEMAEDAHDIAAAETDGFTLFVEQRSRRDGTGETRRTLSWIWSTSKGMDDPENQQDDILRAEWAKSRARAARGQEEVQLVQEEMRRTLVYLRWKAEWWTGHAALRQIDNAMAEALKAYSCRQAELQCALATRFQSMWEKPLSDDLKKTSTNNPAQCSDNPAQLSTNNPTQVSTNPTQPSTNDPPQAAAAADSIQASATPVDDDDDEDDDEDEDEDNELDFVDRDFNIYL